MTTTNQIRLGLISMILGATMLAVSGASFAHAQATTSTTTQSSSTPQSLLQRIQNLRTRTSQIQANLQSRINSAFGTGTTSPTTPGSSMGTTTGNGSGTTTAPTMSAANLRVALNGILRDHVSTSLEVLRAINRLPNTASSSPELSAALAVQDQNAVELSNAIGSVYGESANAQFLALFRKHIVDSNAYTMGIRDGSVANQQAALADLDLQLQSIASFLSTANPNLDYATLLSALREHERLVNESSLAHSRGDYAGSYRLEQQALVQISGGADYIAAAIVKQYPAKFSN